VVVMANEVVMVNQAPLQTSLLSLFEESIFGGIRRFGR